MVIKGLQRLLNRRRHFDGFSGIFTFTGSSSEFRASNVRDLRKNVSGGDARRACHASEYRAQSRRVRICTYYHDGN